MKKLLTIFCGLIVATLCNAQPNSGSGPQGGSAWGGINGTLSAQTDLQTALDLKAPLASPTFTGTASAATITASGDVTALGSVGIGTATPGTSLDLSKTSVGGPISARIRNLDNTSIASHANVNIESGGSAGGDPSLTWTVQGSVVWSAGLDNSDSDKWKLGSSSTVGTSTKMTVDAPTGTVTANAFSGAGTLLTAINGENIQDDTIDEDSIDFGTGPGQVSAVDIPITDSGGILAATEVEAALQEVGKIVTKVHSAGGSYTVGTTSTAEVYRGRIIVTAAGTVQLPPVFPGMEFMVTVVGNIAVSVDSNASDLIVLNGIALDDGDKITNDSLAGSTVVFTYYNATGWIAVSDGTWTDTGP